MLRLILQLLGIAVLIPAVAWATLALDNRNADGPSILFPGGELVSGDLHSGPEPDWSFTRDIPTVELQLMNPPTSRLIYILESEGRLYVVSGYMGSTLGRIWKHWAVEADEGDGIAVVRINGVRYERQIVRIREGEALDGVTAALREKYGGNSSRASVESGNLWVFELAPRGPNA